MSTAGTRRNLARERGRTDGDARARLAGPDGPRLLPRDRVRLGPGAHPAAGAPGGEPNAAAPTRIRVRVDRGPLGLAGGALGLGPGELGPGPGRVVDPGAL